MKILFAADGSTFTKKALTFLVKNKNLLGPDDELVVLHVQDAVSAMVERELGSAEVTAYQAKQADLVLNPIQKFLDKVGIPITPAKLQMWEWIPESLLVRSLMLWADTNHFKTAAVEHTAAAADEMHQIAQEFRTLTLSSSMVTPAIDELRSFIPSPV